MDLLCFWIACKTKALTVFILDNFIKGVYNKQPWNIGEVISIAAKMILPYMQANKLVCHSFMDAGNIVKIMFYSGEKSRQTQCPL